MKYIRTKNGVYKVSHYNDWATHKRKGATLIDGYKTSYIKNENIIAQSETIEELCDGFYIDDGIQIGRNYYMYSYNPINAYDFLDKVVSMQTAFIQKQYAKANEMVHRLEKTKQLRGEYKNEISICNK